MRRWITPPGRTTRAISASARSAGAMCSIADRDTSTSKQASGNASRVASARTKRTGSPARALASRPGLWRRWSTSSASRRAGAAVASDSNSRSRRSTPTARPTATAERTRQVMPSPHPTSSTVARSNRLCRATVLDVGCGDGITCLVLSAVAVGRAVGVDLRLPLFESDATAAPARRLAELVLQRLHSPGRLANALPGLPVRFVRADATRLAFPDACFDLLVSRSAMEHIAPVERALAEMARVVRPGGVIHLRVDPYFWLRGCHKRGLVDIPWAHARMTLEDFRRF